MRVGRKPHAILPTNSKIYNYTQAAHHCLPLLQAHTLHQFHYPANWGPRRAGKASILPVLLVELLISQENAQLFHWKEEQPQSKRCWSFPQLLLVLVLAGYSKSLSLLPADTLRKSHNPDVDSLHDNQTAFSYPECSLRTCNLSDHWWWWPLIVVKTHMT